MKHQETLWQRLAFYLNPNDGRYEDLAKGNRARNIFKDLTAGLIVAAVAIPLAMGFAMASGLRPEQGIVGGAVAGLIGALFGGSKYQVYGPTAAFIPVIAGLMATYNHGFLVLVAIIAGVMLMLSGLFRFGRIVEKVPHSIVVGFTIGIATFSEKILLCMSALEELVFSMAGFTLSSKPVRLPICTLSHAPLIAPQRVCPTTIMSLEPTTLQAYSMLPSISSFTTFPAIRMLKISPRP